MAPKATPVRGASRAREDASKEALKVIEEWLAEQRARNKANTKLGKRGLARLGGRAKENAADVDGVSRASDGAGSGGKGERRYEESTEDDVRMKSLELGVPGELEAHLQVDHPNLSIRKEVRNVTWRVVSCN